MPMNSYQYGTSPRKYEPDYTEVKVKKVKIEKNLEKKKVNTKAKRTPPTVWSVKSTIRS